MELSADRRTGIAVLSDAYPQFSTNRGVVVWDVRTGRILANVGKGSYTAAAVMDDRSSALLGRADGTLETWDIGTGARLSSVKIPPASATPGRDPGPVIAILPRLRDILVRAGPAAAVSWNSRSGTVEYTTGPNSDDISLVPGGRFTVSRGDGAPLRIVGTGRLPPIRTIAGTEGVRTFAFSSDGEVLALVRPNQSDVEVWSVGVSARVGVVRGLPDDPISDVQLSDDGSRLLVTIRDNRGYKLDISALAAKARSPFSAGRPR